MNISVACISMPNAHPANLRWKFQDIFTPVHWLVLYLSMAKGNISIIRINTSISICQFIFFLLLLIFVQQIWQSISVCGLTIRYNQKIHILGFDFTISSHSSIKYFINKLKKITEKLPNQNDIYFVNLRICSFAIRRLSINQIDVFSFFIAAF